MMQSLAINAASTAVRIIVTVFFMPVSSVLYNFYNIFKIFIYIPVFFFLLFTAANITAAAIITATAITAIITAAVRP